MSKKALMVWGGWSGHTPKESVDVFAPLLGDAGYQVTISDTLDSYLDAAMLAELDLIVPMWTMGTVTKEQSKGLREAVRNGAGLGGWHGGIIDSFRQDTEYQWMTGGQWVAHPGNCIERYKVIVTDQDHPITEGIDDFELTGTEQYYCHVDPGNAALCHTVFSGGHGAVDLYPRDTVMPYAWTRLYGRGKVFVAAWGHTYKDFDVPEAKEIVRRGLLWSARTRT
ncbi:MAG: ThuA domain-containing protein [Phycisphaeraceae bacterium]|nr:ThuA domain-containing protein [Phycisphaeraceae bacterium]